jgi:hypothetical protein
MNTGTKELKSILDELDELKLPHMAAELETLYKQPAFVNTGRLELISTIIHAEYIVTIAAMDEFGNVGEAKIIVTVIEASAN